MTSTRGLGSTGSYTGGSARWEGLEDRQKTVNVRDLPQESQAAHEILKELKVQDPKGRATVLSRAEVKEPLGQKGLAAVADLYFRLDMPLTTAGIARFKAERGLGSGPSLAGSIAKAYARAVVGGEVLFRVDRNEEMNLRPADKACLGFLRAWSRMPGVAELLGRLKEALDLGNPEVSADAVGLANEYVGAQTVREVSKASSTKNCPLTPEGMVKLIALVEADKDKVPTTRPKPNSLAAKPATNAPTTPATPAASPTTLPSKFAGSLPGARIPTMPKHSPPIADPATTPSLQRPAPASTTEAATTPSLPRPHRATPSADPLTSTSDAPSSLAATSTPPQAKPPAKTSDPTTQPSFSRSPLRLPAADAPTQPPLARSPLKLPPAAPANAPANAPADAQPPLARSPLKLPVSPPASDPSTAPTVTGLKKRPT